MSVLKLAHRLRSHDWMAALIELAIVIVGILIALQVSNWNQDRADRARGEGYARRIHSELSSDRANMTSTGVFWKQVMDYQIAAIANAEHGQLAKNSNWQTVLSWYQAGQLRPLELEDTSFAEMRDAGDLGLFTDESLRTELSRYYRTTGTGLTAQVLRHDPVYRVQIRGLTPSHVQAYIWTKCFQQLEGTDQRLLDCPSPISEAEAAALLATYRADPTLLQNLRYWNTWMRVSSFVMEDSQRRAGLLDAKVLAVGK